MFDHSRKRLLEPTERIGEALFGLIMVLTFTGSLSIADAGRDDVRTMLIGALGCNLAWGIIDGVFYLMDCLSARARDIRTLIAVRQAASGEDAHRLIADSLPPAMAMTLSPIEYESMRAKLMRSPEPHSRPRLGKDEWLASLSVFFWVFLTTFPVSIPFIFFDEVSRAMRISNAIAVALLFLAGYAYGRVVGYRPWITGIAMLVLGSILVALTITLGG